MKRLLLVCGIAGLVIIFHQLAQYHLFGLIEAQGKPIEVTGFFNIVKVWNQGVSFGMFNQLAYGQWLLSGMAIIITLILLRWLSRTHDRLTTIALCLVIGGAIGNTIDRLRYGAVADYLDFHAFGHHWPAFNFTDSAIFLGVMFLVAESFFKSRLQTNSGMLN